MALRTNIYIPAFKRISGSKECFLSGRFQSIRICALAFKVSYTLWILSTFERARKHAYEHFSFFWLYHSLSVLFLPLVADHIHDVKLHQNCNIGQLIWNFLPHVDLIKCSQHSTGVLGFLQPLGDSQPHAVHLNLSLKKKRCKFKSPDWVKSLR